MLVGKPGHVAGGSPGSGKDSVELEGAGDVSHTLNNAFTPTHSLKWWDRLARWSDVEPQLQMLPRQETAVLPVRSGSTGNGVCYLFWLVDVQLMHVHNSPEKDADGF